MPETVAHYTPQPDGDYHVIPLEGLRLLCLETGDIIPLEANGPPDEDGRVPLRVKVEES